MRRWCDRSPSENALKQDTFVIGCLGCTDRSDDKEIGTKTKNQTTLGLDVTIGSSGKIRQKRETRPFSIVIEKRRWQ